MNNAVRLILLILSVLTLGFGLTSEPALQHNASNHQQDFSNQYNLNLILFTDDQQMALINGQKVIVGDKIDDSIVVAISPNSVILAKNNQLFTLYLSNHFINVKGIRTDKTSPSNRAIAPWRQLISH